MLDHVVEQPVGVPDGDVPHDGRVLVQLRLLGVLVDQLVVLPIRVLRQHALLVHRDYSGEERG